MSGYFQSDRQVAQAFLPKHGDQFTFSEAYTFLSSFAAFAPREEIVGGKLISLNVGELVASERYLESRLSWSRTKVRSFKDMLIKKQLLDQRKDQGETILRLCYARDSKQAATSKRTTKETSKETAGEPEENQGGTNIRRRKKEEGIKKEEEALTLPFDSLEFSKAWSEWIEYRKAKRVTITPITLKRQLKILGAQIETDAVVTLNQSMDNGWTGLFPPKENQTKPKPNSRTAGTHNEGQTFGAGVNPNQVELIPGLD